MRNEPATLIYELKLSGKSFLHVLDGQQILFQPKQATTCIPIGCSEPVFAKKKKKKKKKSNSRGGGELLFLRNGLIALF